MIERWHGLFSGLPLSQRYLWGNRLSSAETKRLEEVAEQWRERLMSISWFMRCLNEHIARLANTEDHCTGRFWEGRFKCQALLDDAALAACLAYVDLNPIRAGIAKTPETSDHTAVQRRIKALLNSSGDNPPQPPELMPFVGNPRQDIPKGLAFLLEDYISLVDWIGRQLRGDKRGSISEALPPILQRLAIDSDAWLSLTREFETHFNSLAGRAEEIQRTCESRGSAGLMALAHPDVCSAPDLSLAYLYLPARSC